MKEIARVLDVDGYKVVDSFQEATIDPEASRKAGKPVYFDYDSAKYKCDYTEAQVADIKERMQKPNTLVLTDGSEICNYKSQDTYCVKEGDEWREFVIDKVGVEIPAGAVRVNECPEYQQWKRDKETPPEVKLRNEQAERRSAILSRLNAIDNESARPARSVALAVANGEAPAQADVDKLSSLEAEAASLRQELAGIPAAEA